ncbi:MULTISPECIES: hypothetical protein [Mycobacteriaceae]|uniref:hypothetical protein n=1 Tax=Mycobacteriaceae TaxID=1762 RepID=UPI0007FC63B7|nr:MULTISPECIES: hypothetical protein [Mycobacteriaceae]MCK0177191.1 hypothetical protein [Mycolicibacterium sp. F2034L]OBB59510.1 hypothetical protein A5757_13135 [Mycobacterium sp. 852013-51886_SCH5428379]
MAQPDELPLADYDQLALPDLRHRIRSLEEPQLQTLFEHETSHGNRIPVLEILHARLKELHQGAEPSGGDQRNAPGATSTSTGSTVQEKTAAEPNTPLRHGVANQTPARGRT